MKLEQLGWSAWFAQAFQALEKSRSLAGRVVRASRDRFTVFTDQGECEAEVSGKLRHSSGAWPATGDWVVLRSEGNLIEAVLPRKTKFSRKEAGERTEEQILAANVDVLFLVAALDGDFNLRRLERYLLLAYESGAEPVIVLNKADLCPQAGLEIARVRSIAAGATVLLMSALRTEEVDQLTQCMTRGQTAALLGSSGVGKSTIVNQLLGREEQAIASVRESDSRGRHTTTHRELFILPAGWLLIDLPGLRELQLWAEPESIHRTFPELDEFSSRCRFRDCRHQGEPGCAVAAALVEGTFDETRFQSYLKLQRELDFLDRRQDERAAVENKKAVKRIHRAMRRRAAICDKW